MKAFHSDEAISCELIPETERFAHTASLFGYASPLRLEPTIFYFAGQLSDDYQGGYWQFYKLGNGEFFMAPDDDKLFAVSSQ